MLRRLFRFRNIAFTLIVGMMLLYWRSGNIHDEDDRASHWQAMELTFDSEKMSKMKFKAKSQLSSLKLKQAIDLKIKKLEDNVKEAVTKTDSRLHLKMGGLLRRLVEVSLFSRNVNY